MYENVNSSEKQKFIVVRKNYRGVLQSTVKKKAFKVLLHLLNLYTLAIHYIGI